MGRLASRRTVATSLGAFGLSLLARPTFAQQPGAADAPPPTAEEIAAALPIKTTGLEHVAMIVPDVSLSARFYSKLFNPTGLHKEQEGDLRFYVELTPGYIAIGDRPNPPPPFLDHFCALVVDYKPAAMAARLAEEGLPQGRFGIFPDPDGIGLQLLGVPAGLASTTEPATRLVNGEALAAPLGLHHMLLNVDDIERSAAFYGEFFAGAQTRESEPDRIWIEIEGGTRIGLQQRPPTEPPRVDEFAVKVAPFDRAALIPELRLIGAVISPDDPKDPSVLRFRDPYGLGVALKPA